MVLFFFCKQKTAYEMRISDWSSDVCSSDLRRQVQHRATGIAGQRLGHGQSHRGDVQLLQPLRIEQATAAEICQAQLPALTIACHQHVGRFQVLVQHADAVRRGNSVGRSEEHTSELQSLMRISYAVFCLKKKTKQT